VTTRGESQALVPWSHGATADERDDRMGAEAADIADV
jgi:hypothetical protein